jgi:predicted polyphosphate/ATP-dependent NAD kinase
VLGIPAGVKIHSATFAVTPQGAGWLAGEFLQGGARHLRQAEVVDLDEAAYRQGRVTTHLYGYLQTPDHHLVQNQKAPSPASELAQAQAIAQDVIERMLPGERYILGPGSLPFQIAARLGLEKTLLGVDVVTLEQVVALDVGESQLEALFDVQVPRIVVTPIGGQGFLFGRGNQQIGPGLLRRAGKENLVVVSLPAKIHALRSRPLLLDTGDAELDAWLSGYLEVITGYHERIIYRVGLEEP